MQRVGLLLFAILIVLLPQARADVSLQDFGVNINGTTNDYNNQSETDTTTLPGMNASGFSTATSGDGLDTGLGALIYTFNPGAAGSYFVNFYFDLSASTPFFNEFGSAHGAAGASDPTSWEIAQVNPSVGGIQFCGWTGSTCSPATIFPSSLDNTNHVPVGNTNFLNNCKVAPCNADVAEAVGFNFVLGAGEEAVITIDSSTTNPGGFYLEQSHPVDPGNTKESDVFLSGNISIQPIVVGQVPEPSSLPLLALVAAAVVGFQLRRKIFAR
jgi:PEP-CTERM motif-containing protein